MGQTARRRAGSGATAALAVQTGHQHRVRVLDLLAAKGYVRVRVRTGEVVADAPQWAPYPADLSVMDRTK